VITATDYFTAYDGKEPRDMRDRYPTYMTPQIEHDAEILVACVNVVAARANLTAKVSSGWRPAPYNATVSGASRTSLHMVGRAVDLDDQDGHLDDFFMSKAGEALLVEFGIWHEHPSSTPRWCHLQSKPPPSGNRHFYK
jgi:hypothetical protein